MVLTDAAEQPFYVLTEHPERAKWGTFEMESAPAPARLGDAEATAPMRFRAEGDTLLVEVTAGEQTVTFGIHRDALERVMEMFFGS
jgi:hypothetical protein